MSCNLYIVHCRAMVYGGEKRAGEGFMHIEVESAKVGFSLRIMYI